LFRKIFKIHTLATNRLPS